MPQANSEIIEAISNCNIDDLIYRMILFTIKKLGKNKSNYVGKEPEDFVFSVFEKALSGIKNWPSEKVEFDYFMFKALQNEIWAHRKKLERRKKDIVGDDDIIDESYLIDIPPYIDSENIAINQHITEDIDFPAKKESLINQLKDSGATEEELWIFECWCDGIFKPSEIEKVTDMDIKTIYNALKRLEKRRKKIQGESHE